MTLRILAAAAISATLLVSPAMAASCISIEAFIGSTPRASKNVVLTGDVAQEWLGAFNQVPPRSEFEGETLILVRYANTPVLLGIFSNKCMVTARRISPQAIVLTNRLLGDPV